MSVLNLFLNLKKIDDEQLYTQIHDLQFNQNLTLKLIDSLETNEKLLCKTTRLKFVYVYGPIRLFNVGYLYLLLIYKDNRIQIKRIEVDYYVILKLIKNSSKPNPNPNPNYSLTCSTTTTSSTTSTTPTASNDDLSIISSTQKCRVYWKYSKQENINQNFDYQAYVYSNNTELPKILQNYFQFQIKHSILNELFRNKKEFFSEKIEKTMKFIQLTSDLLKLTQIQSLKSFLYQDIIINLYLEMNKVLFTARQPMITNRQQQIQQLQPQQRHYLAHLTEIQISKLIVYKSNEELKQIADMVAYTSINLFKQNNLLIIPLKSNDLGNNYYFYKNNVLYIIQITVIHKLNLNHKLKLLAKLFHRQNGLLTNLWRYIHGKQLRFQLIFISYENRRSTFEKLEKTLFSNTVLSNSNQFMAFEDFKFHLKNFDEAKEFFENIESL